LHALGRTALVHVQNLLRGFVPDGSGLVSSVRTGKDIVALLSQEWAETCDRRCTPVVTCWTCLRQLPSEAPSCRAAVARLKAARVAQGLAPWSPLTGGACKARQRRPETRRPRLVSLRGPRLQPQRPGAWHWHGRAVQIVDGSGGSMPDTEANHEAYPPPGSQAPGLGVPVARLVGVVSLACGAGLPAAVGRIKGPQTREIRRFHGRPAHRERDAVVLADRCACSSWEGAVLLGQGIDIVRRWPQRRPVDCRGGRRVGREDHSVSWTKPKRPAWRDEATSAVLPAPVDMRERRGRVAQRGCRPRVVRGATTVLDAQGYPTAELAGLSRARWHAALARRAIKQTMQRDGLRCKTPAMVRKEIWGHLLVDNLLRAAMAHAALGHGVRPRQGSVQGARQTLTAVHSQLAQASPSRREGRIQSVLSAIARHRVGTRPDRSEPRAVKRRPKPYPLLRVPRQQARARLAAAA